MINLFLGSILVALNLWQFSVDGEHYKRVSVPHSYNAVDGHSASYYRGQATYKCHVWLDGKPSFLLFEGVGQSAMVYVDGELAASHKGGYTPFTVDLKGRRGRTEVKVICDNSLDPNLAPVSSDFNKNGGLHYPVQLLKYSDVFFSPQTHGMYRMHVSTQQVCEQSAVAKVETCLENRSRKDRTVTVEWTLRDAAGARVHRALRRMELPAGQVIGFADSTCVSAPHLWNGVQDPYLYTIQMRIRSRRGWALDRAFAHIGFRFFEADAQHGFKLNGKPYPLRGVCMHQDMEGRASALRAQDFEADYAFVKEIGANFVRLAHYPHNDRAFSIADRIGLVVQTEIPWVNVCGVRADSSYFENLSCQLSEMIGNLYNHPSIVFWGLWNEVDFWGNTDEYQGEIDAPRAIEEVAKLYRQAKELDPCRLVGVTDDSGFRRLGFDTLKMDFYSENRYNGYYYDLRNFEQLTRDMNWIRDNMGAANVSEYGCGVNPYAHTNNEDLLQVPVNDFHYEEFGNKFHESYAQQIAAMPWLTFTSIWILFDFPVANRTEGFMDCTDGVNAVEHPERKYMNDKGLVTRDRQLRKDAFYLYKSWWNKEEETVYIASRRFTHRAEWEPFTLTVYSNAKSLTLYQDGEFVCVLNSSGESTGVIWKFPGLWTDHDTEFEVISDSGKSDRISIQVN